MFDLPPSAAKYPSVLDDDVSLFKLTDRKTFTLATGITDTSEAMVVNESCAGMIGNFYLAFQSGEMVYVTSVVEATKTMTIRRGVGGTFAVTHNAAESLKLIVTAQLFEQFKRVIIAIENELGVLAKGAFSSVAARLSSAESKMLSHDHSGGAQGAQINADRVDGYHATVTPTASSVPVSSATGKLDSWISAATTALSGLVRLATSAEIAAGTDAAKAITPSTLAHSTPGIRMIEVCVLDANTVPVVMNALGSFYFVVPAELNGMKLVSAHGAVFTASTSGKPTFGIYNMRTGQMLITSISIDLNEKTSYTASVPPAITSGAANIVATGDLIRFDCTAAGTGTKGCAIIMGFQVP